MPQNINHGEYYIKNRRKQESILKENALESNTSSSVEGFDVINPDYQKKHSDKFLMADGIDPGQTVMCEVDKVRYVRLNQTNNFLTIQEVEVYDETGQNVALTGGYNYDNKYNSTKGLCRTDYGGAGFPGAIYQGQLTENECRQKCENNSGLQSNEYCSAFEIQSEETVGGEDIKCYTYRDPNVTGSGSNNEICRVRERKQGTPIATMSTQYENTNPYMAINGIKDGNQKWPNSACTASSQGGWWEVDLGQEVDVKRLVIYNRPDGKRRRLNGAILTLIDRNHNTVFTKQLNGNRMQEINVDLKKQSCGGPVIKKNMVDFEEVKETQLQFNRELQEYNQAFKHLIGNSSKYIAATNKSNNKFANPYINDSYRNLNNILNKMYNKITELSAEDIKLNEHLLNEYTLLKNRLNQYEHVNKEIKVNKNMMNQTRALSEDSNLQMLSYNQKYIIWSIIALGVTAGAIKLMKN